MSNNHLFIGLGGQGVKSIAELRRLSVKRKTQFKELGIDDPTNPNPTSKFRFLVIDSNLEPSNLNWSYMGENVSLEKDEWIKIDYSTLPENGIVDLAAKKHIQPWLNGKESFLREELGSTQAVKGANQMRRFGRLLGAANAQNITERIEQKVRSFGSDEGAVEKKCSFHIFATLGGGTGSGTIVDIVSFIRNRYKNQPNGGNYPIYLYLYIAGKHIEFERKTEYFFLNQYTALRDLNAINVGAYEPDIALLSGDNEKLAKKDGVDGIEQIFISCDEAGNGREISLDKQIPHMAEICFNRVYVMDNKGEGVDPGLKNALSGEDKVRNYSAEPENSQKERSYRFAVACVKRWTMPVEQCKENLFYFTYKQLLYKWLYKNWEPNQGYTQHSTFTAEQKNALTNIIETEIHNEKRTEEEDTYKKNIRLKFSNILKEYKQTNWTESALDELEVKFRRLLETSGSEQGILSLEEFAKAQLKKGLEIIYQTVKPKIEEETAKAISQQGRGLDDMLNSLKKTKDNFDKEIKEEEEKEQELNDSQKNQRVKLEKSLNRRKKEVEKITFLSTLFNKHHSLLDAHCEDCFVLFAVQFESKMRSVKTKLNREISQMLEELVTKAQQTVDKFKQRAEEIDKELAKSNRNLESLKSQKSIFVKYEFDYEDLTKIHDGLSTNKKLLDDELKYFDDLWKNYAENMCKAVASPNKINALFTALEQNNVENNNLWKTAEKLHNRLIANDSFKGSPVLDGSLVNRLENRLKTPSSRQQLEEEIDLFMDEICASAATDLSAASVPNADSCPNLQGAPLACLSMGISKEKFDTAKDLKNLFKSKLPTKMRIQKELTFYPSSDQYEISLMYIMYWMPVRFISAVKHLAEKYHNLDLKRYKTNYFVNIDPSGENDERPELTYSEAEENARKSFPLDAYWQAKLLSCGDENDTPIVTTNKKDSLGRSLVERHQYIEGHVGTEDRVMNQRRGMYITEDEFLKKVSMADMIEIQDLVNQALARVSANEFPEHVAKELKDKALKIYKTAKEVGGQDLADAQNGYNNFVDALKQRHLIAH